MYPIHINVADNIIHAVLDDCAMSRELLALLPLQVSLSDYAATEKVAELPRELSTLGVHQGFKPELGDITYYAPWGNLAIFYQDFGFAKGLVKLGHIEQGIEHLSYRGRKSALISLA